MKNAAIFGLFATVTGFGANASGHWQGAIDMPRLPLPFILDLAQNPEGVWIGSVTVTGSSSVDVPVKIVAMSGLEVRFTVDLPARSSFDGHLSEDGLEISGIASSAEGMADFKLKRSGEANVKVSPPSTALPQEFEGIWEGAMDVDGKPHRVGVKLSSADGLATGTLIAIDQGRMEIPATTVIVQGKELRLEARAISGVYRGTLGSATEIAGEWTEAQQQFPLTLKRVSQ